MGFNFFLQFSPSMKRVLNFFFRLIGLLVEGLPIAFHDFFFFRELFVALLNEAYLIH